MDNIVREGEQMFEGQGGNKGDEIQGNFSGDQQGQQQSQPRDQQQSGGGGMMKSFEQNAGDAYVNQEVNGFLNKEGVPTAMDGAIDGAVDTEANKLEKDF